MLETGLLETLKSDDADERTIDEYHQDVTDALYITAPRVQPSQSPRSLGLETSRGQPQQLERRPMANVALVSRRVDAPTFTASVR